MISSNDAIDAAKKYLPDIAGIDAHNIILEETELSDDNKFLYITLSFYRKRNSKEKNILDMDFLPEYERAYRVFKVDTETGKVISMKIHDFNLAHAR